MTATQAIPNSRYATRHTYVTDIVEFARKDKPDAWTTVDQYAGQMFMSYPVFEFVPGTKADEEPIRYGDFVVDIDTKELACGSATAILEWFDRIFGVSYDQWRVFLSGVKGVHLELPAEILGTEAGHKVLTLGYKRLAKEIEGELTIKLDTSMYNRGTGKPWRQVNVMREGGTCKRQIEADVLWEIETEEEYKNACREPGDFWMPVDMERNEALATKLQTYLKDAEAQADTIKSQPAITGDDLDRLTNNCPPCIGLISNLTHVVAGNTFNDIAIQLTAYAVTIGVSEQEFLYQCGPFIQHYPSSSLTSEAKRVENCRARYRTMSMNGNQHSCGGILALKIPGFDCSKCVSRQNGPDLGVEVVTAKDVDLLGTHTLHIPEDILNPGGLISLGMRALKAPGMADIPQYNLAVVLTTIANAIGGKMTALNVWPNVFNLKIGRSSTGKSSSDKAMTKALRAVEITDFYGLTDFASGAALLRSLIEKPVQLMVIDECTSMFRRYEKGDSLSDGKRDVLMEVYSASGSRLEKGYSDGKNNIVVESPCLSLTGNATEVIFESLQQADFNTGVLQRFDFWAYDGPTPSRQVRGNGENQDLVEFAKGIKAIKAAYPDKAFLTGVLSPESAYPLPVTEGALDALQAWSHEVTGLCNKDVTDGDSALISRMYDLAIKYSMVHVAGTRPIEALFLPLDVQDVAYGVKVAKMLVGWKLNILKGKITSGDFHAKCEMFKDAIRACIKTGLRPTFNSLRNRKAGLSNWPKKVSQDVIAVLLKRREIVLDETKRTTAYQLLKPCHDSTESNTTKDKQ